MDRRDLEIGQRCSSEQKEQYCLLALGQSLEEREKEAASVVAELGYFAGTS